jgi:hypothetical protein
VGALTTFDRLFAEGAPLVRQRLHQRERPPVDGGRWSVSVVLRPDPVAAGRLERTMTQAEAHAGAGHFRTGTADSVRFHYADEPAGRLMRPQVLASARTGVENGFAGIEG